MTASTSRRATETPSEWNLIADNRGPGLDLANQSTTTTVENNTIVRNALAAGTEQFGVRITNQPGATNNLIRRNIVADNTGAGVLIRDPSAPYFSVEITENSIFGNTGLGIDLLAGAGPGIGDGVTPNDADDTDGGPNELQNFPVLTGGSYNGTTLTVAGSLNSAPGTYRIEFFASSAADPSGEGQRYLGSTTVNLAAPGTVAIAFAQAVALNAGESITATATNTGTGQTSEFSAALDSVQGHDLRG